MLDTSHTGPFRIFRGDVRFVVSPAMRALNSKHTTSLNASCETEPLTYKRQRKMMRLYCRRSVAKPRRWHRERPDAHGWRTKQRHCPINAAGAQKCFLGHTSWGEMGSVSTSPRAQTSCPTPVFEELCVHDFTTDLLRALHCGASNCGVVTIGNGRVRPLVGDAP